MIDLWTIFQMIEMSGWGRCYGFLRAEELYFINNSDSAMAEQ